MLALLSVWTGLVSLLSGLLMLAWRRTFTDLGVVIGLYAAIFALTFAGVAAWALRKEDAGEPGVRQQRTQCRIGAGMALVGIIIVYGLVAADRAAGG